ncbi:hypothetical protein R9X47_03320 [Wukongibacter baidiensis]|uniref:hypothetical protein n=1 Tax=Wukongibacter baidiensis TaxID=1723361 RepID=UPI003D7F3C83
MRDNKNLKKFGDLVLFSYFGVCTLLLVLRIPELTLIKKIVFLIGAIIGFGLKVVIILMYWYIIKTKYVNEEKKIKLTHIIIGALLVMLAAQSSGLNFIETFVFISIGIILRNGYKISLR